MTVKDYSRLQSWYDFFILFQGDNHYVKITCLESKKINWESVTGEIKYSGNEKLYFKENRPYGSKYEFDIIEVNEAESTFKSFNGMFKIELI